MGRRMRVVVTGASGNVGTSVLRALADEREFFEISSATGRGVRELVRAVERRLDEIGKAPIIQTRETLLGDFEG